MHQIGKKQRLGAAGQMEKIVSLVVVCAVLPAFTVIGINISNAIGYFPAYGETIFAVTVLYFLLFSVVLFGSFIFLSSAKEVE